MDRVSELTAQVEMLREELALLTEVKAAGDWAPCPECGSTRRDEFVDGTARCEDCGEPLSRSESKALDLDDPDLDLDDPDVASAEDLRTLDARVEAKQAWLDLVSLLPVVDGEQAAEGQSQ